MSSNSIKLDNYDCKLLHLFEILIIELGDNETDKLKGLNQMVHNPKLEQRWYIKEAIILYSAIKEKDKPRVSLL